MVNVAAVAKYLSRLALMKYFPSDPDARTALVEMVCGMINSDEQADWLAKRVLQVYAEWPGPHELRACFCCRYKPRDGVNAYSTVYPEGLPPDPTVTTPRIEAPARLALPPGHTVSAGAQCEAAVHIALEAMPRMPSSRLSDGRRLPDNAGSRALRQATTAPRDRAEISGPAPQIITQTDIDRAVAEHRAKAGGGQ